MKTNSTCFARDNFLELSLRLAGIAHLMDNFQSRGHREGDDERIQGVGLVIEDLARKARRLYSLMDQLDLLDLKEIETEEKGMDELGAAEAQIREIREIKTRVTRIRDEK